MVTGVFKNYNEPQGSYYNSDGLSTNSMDINIKISYKYKCKNTL